MNAEIKARWIAALRSGKYQQGHGYLRIKDRFCCLGVLCDVVEPSKWKQVYGVDYFRHDFYSAGFPSVVFLNRIELAQGSTKELVQMNDHQDKTFAEIANHIEANL